MLVSVIALGTALLHAVFPHVEIDITTAALLSLAALPWLAPIVKSLKLPGGVEIVLRDLQDTVTDVQARVQEGADRVEDLTRTIERLSFTGAPLRPEFEERIQSHIEALAGSLSRAGFPIPTSAPRVVVDKPGAPPFYLPGDARGDDEIHISSDTSDPAVAVRPYLFYVLRSVHPDAPWDARRAVVERALTFYYYADFAWGELVFAGDLRDAEPSETASDQVEQWPISAAWARMLWTLRPVLGPDVTAEMLAQAWMNSTDATEDFYGAYARNVVAAVGTSHQPDRLDEVREIFASKDIPVVE